MCYCASAPSIFIAQPRSDALASNATDSRVPAQRKVIIRLFTLYVLPDGPCVAAAAHACFQRALLLFWGHSGAPNSSFAGLR